MEKTENKSSKLTEIILLIFGILCFVLIAAELTTNLKKTFDEKSKISKISDIPPEAKQTEPGVPDELSFDELREMLPRVD